MIISLLSGIPIPIQLPVQWPWYSDLWCGFTFRTSSSANYPGASCLLPVPIKSSILARSKQTETIRAQKGFLLWKRSSVLGTLPGIDCVHCILPLASGLCGPPRATHWETHTRFPSPWVVFIVVMVNHQGCTPALAKSFLHDSLSSQRKPSEAEHRGASAGTLST